MTKTTVHFSEAYNEYRVAVGKSTYYTSDVNDAFDTLYDMMAKAGLPTTKPVRVKKANADIEDNW